MASTSADRGRNPTPRFTSETKPGGQQQTAKHHSISMPKSWSYRRSLDEPEKFIPGAFPEDDGKHDSAHGAGVHAEHRSWLKTDLPTHEQPSGSRGGVGSLPGPHNARGVAILPDERIHPEGPTTHPLTDECLPTHEHPSGSRIGVGSLPGPNNESGVAILPDERDCDNSKAVPDVPPKDQILVTQSVVVDEQNPIPHPAHSIPGLTQPGSEPGDTIFSATQRAKERDPTFTHGAGVSTSDHPIHESATTIPEQGGDTARHTPTQVGHGASGVIEAVEGVAADVYHGAEHMLHNVEAYFTGGTKPQPDVGRERGGTIRAKNSKSQPVSGDASVNTGLNAAQSQPSQVNPHSQDLPQSMEGMQISGAPTPLPKALQNEYYRAGEYDLYGDKLDTNQFSYDDDISWESGVFAPDVPLGPDGVNERDRASDHARAGYTPSDGCRATRHSLGEGDIAVGYGGVQYNVAGKDGILPGYPTREGMAKLISDRIRDDHLRAAGAQNPTGSVDSRCSGSSASSIQDVDLGGGSQLLRAESNVSNRAVRGSYSELSSEGSSPPEDPFANRIVEEKRETPVFEGGGSTAAGKYEATFTPVISQPEEFRDNPLSKDQKEAAAAGKLEAKFGPTAGSSEAKTTSGSPAYLGKPLEKPEEIIEVEKDRQLADKKTGIN